MNIRRLKRLGKYKILVEKHRRFRPDQRSESTEILQPDTIVEAVDIVYGWLKLKDGGYVFGGNGKYAKYIGE